MSDETIVHFCSPTLACIKAGSLFSVIGESESEIQASICRINKLKNGTGPRAVLLRYNEDHRTGLVYLYRTSVLRDMLSDPYRQRILRQCGYSEFDLDSCLDILSSRLALQDSFPHEIGLFLGYPPDDVEGFIRFKGKSCKCCGLWKVYGDVSRSLRLFDRYQHCTSVYEELLRKGVSIEKLIVPER